MRCGHVGVTSPEDYLCKAFGFFACRAFASFSSTFSFLYSSYHSFICAFVPPALSSPVIYANLEAMSCAEGMVMNDKQECKSSISMKLGRKIKALIRESR